MASGTSSKDKAVLDQEQENYFRLFMLISERGTDVYRRAVTLFTTAKCNVATLTEVLAIAQPFQRKISPHFVKSFLWPIFDPANPVAPITSVDQLDITSCNALLNLVNISDLTDGNNESLQEELGKIKEFRNKLCHSTDQRCDDAIFNQHFEDIRQVLQDIARIKPELEVPDDEVLKYKTLPITLESYRKLMLVVKEVLSEISSLREDLKITKKSVGNLHTDMTKQNEDLKRMMMEEKVKYDKKMVKYDEKIKNLEQMLANMEKKIKTMEDEKYQKLDTRMGKLEVQQEERKKEDKKRKIFCDGYRRKHFVGRCKEMAFLEEMFKKDKSHSIGLVKVAICGTGGYGKTALASEYANKNQDFYKGGVLWFDCDSTQVDSSIRKVCNKLGLGGSEVNECVDNVLDWVIQCPEPVLVLLDNFDADPVSKEMKKLASGSWIERFQGHILVTTRRQPLVMQENFEFEEKCCFQLNEMGQDDALELLMHHVKLQLPDNPEAVKNAKEVCRKLGYLPLAIEQSGMYIKAMKKSVEKDVFIQYLEQFCKLLEILKDRFKAKPISDEYDEERLTIQTTWQINFDHIWKTKAAAGYMMIVLSYLGLKEIPCCLLETTPKQLKNQILQKCLEEEKESPLGVKGLLYTLTEFSIFYHDKDNNCLSVHPLVKQMIRQSVCQKSRIYNIFHDALALIKDAMDHVHHPKDVTKEYMPGKNIDDMESIYPWNMLVHHGEVLISNMRQQIHEDKEKESLQAFLPLFYNEHMAALMYEISIKKCIHGLGQEMIAFRNEAVRVAYFHQGQMPFLNEKTLSVVPFDPGYIHVLKTCLALPVDGKKRKRPWQTEGEIEISISDLCSIASGSDRLIGSQSETGDAYYYMARSRCAVARIESQQAMPHKEGCRCHHILSKPSIIQNGEYQEEVPPFLVRQGFAKRTITGKGIILVLDDGTYDLSAFPKGTLKNVMIIGKCKNKCKLVSSKSPVHLKGIVHFDNVTIACRGTLFAEKSSRVTFSQCNFNGPTEATQLPFDYPQLLSTSLSNTDYLACSNTFLYANNSIVGIYDSYANRIGCFLQLDQCCCILKNSKIIGDLSGISIMSCQSTLRMSDVVIDTFFLGTGAVLGHVNMTRCILHNNKAGFVFCNEQALNSQFYALKGTSEGKLSFKDIKLLECHITGNEDGGIIFGKYMISIRKCKFTRNSRSGLGVGVQREPSKVIISENTFSQNKGVSFSFDFLKAEIEMSHNYNDGIEVINHGWGDPNDLSQRSQDLKNLQVYPSIDKSELSELLSGIFTKSNFCEMLTQYIELYNIAYPYLKGPNDITMKDVFNCGKILNKYFNERILSDNKKSEDLWINICMQEMQTFVNVITHGTPLDIDSSIFLTLKGIPNTEASLPLKKYVVIIDQYCNLIEKLTGSMHLLGNNTRLIERALALFDAQFLPQFKLDMSWSESKGLMKDWMLMCPQENCNRMIPPDKLMQCAKCRIIKYCSIQCLERDEKRHTKLCIVTRDKYTFFVSMPENDVSPKSDIFSDTLIGYYSSQIEQLKKCEGHSQNQARFESDDIQSRNVITMAIKDPGYVTLFKHEPPLHNIYVKSKELYPQVDAFRDTEIPGLPKILCLPARKDPGTGKLQIFFTDFENRHSLLIDLLLQHSNERIKKAFGDYKGKQPTGKDEQK